MAWTPGAGSSFDLARQARGARSLAYVSPHGRGGSLRPAVFPRGLGPLVRVLRGPDMVWTGGKRLITARRRLAENLAGALVPEHLVAIRLYALAKVQGTEQATGPDEVELHVVEPHLLTGFLLGVRGREV